MTIRGLGLALVVACSSATTASSPRGPSAGVRAEIDHAETAEKARRHDVARVHYERAIAAARDPVSVAFAHRELADTLATWGEYREAIAHFEAAVAAVGDDASAWHDLGLLRHKAGDDAGATAALERSRALAPRDWRPRRTLAALQVKLGHHALAIAEYRAMLELDLPAELRSAVERGIELLEKEQAAKGPRGVAKP